MRRAWFGACLAVLLCLLPAIGLSETEENEAREIYVLDTGGSAALADETGEVLIAPGVYSQIMALRHDELYAASLMGESGLGLIRADGTPLTALVYDALEYGGGKIFFRRDGGCGVMDTSGNVLIEPVYTRLIDNGQGGYLALRSDPLDDTPDAVYVVAPDGSEHAAGVRVSFGLQAMSEGLTEAVSTAGLYGYLNGDGEWAIEPVFVWCGAFCSGRALACSAEGMGVIDASGRWLIEPVYRRVVLNDRDAGAPVLAFDGDAALMIRPEDGWIIARFEGGDAAFDGGYVRVVQNGRIFLTDYEGKTVYEAPGDAVGLETRDGYIIVQRAFTEERPYTLIAPDGASCGDWQELSYAGQYGGNIYFLFSTYETTKTDCGGLTFYDETPGTRRYGLIDSGGGVVADGLTALKRTGRKVLSAETDDWIGLIRPDGTVIMRLEKEE